MFCDHVSFIFSDAPFLYKSISYECVLAPRLRSFGEEISKTNTPIFANWHRTTKTVTNCCFCHKNTCKKMSFCLISASYRNNKNVIDAYSVSHYQLYFFNSMLLAQKSSDFQNSFAG